MKTPRPRAPSGRPRARRRHDKTLSQAKINPARLSRWVYNPLARLIPGVFFIVTLLDLGTNILCEFTVTGTKKERARFDYRYQNVNDKYDRSLIVRDEKNTRTFHIRFEKRVCF